MADVLTSVPNTGIGGSIGSGNLAGLPAAVVAALKGQNANAAAVAANAKAKATLTGQGNLLPSIGSLFALAPGLLESILIGLLAVLCIAIGVWSLVGGTSVTVSAKP